MCAGPRSGNPAGYATDTYATYPDPGGSGRPAPRTAGPRKKLNAVGAHTSEEPVVGGDAGTGRATARRRRERGVRTCLPAVLDRGEAPAPGAEAEDNIVRGED